MNKEEYYKKQIIKWLGKAKEAQKNCDNAGLQNIELDELLNSIQFEALKIK